MKIIFLTTQTLSGSTVVGRVLPLAKKLAGTHEVHVLVHGAGDAGSRLRNGDGLTFHEAGKDPFERTAEGKRRHSGIWLIARMKWNAWLMLLELLHLQPDVLIITKPLPENVLAASLFNIFTLGNKHIILDVDDFELTANKLTSIWQRAAVHWAERVGAIISKHIVTATPFLKDHFEQLVPGKPVTLIPTGANVVPTTYNLPRPSEAFGEGGQATSSIIYIGSISVASGHRVDLLPDIMVQVRKKIPDATLIMAGSGDDTEEMKKKFAQKNLEDAVEWTGRFTAKDIPALLGRSSVIIDPIDSGITARAKSSFRVALAAAVGMPVVTSNVGIRPMLLPHLLHDRAFARPEDTVDYANKIAGFFNTPLTELEQGKLKEHSAQFTWEALSATYESVIGSNHG